jgi:prevent-host-death family protein
MAAVIVNVHDAKTHFSRLLDRAHEGEEIVVAKAGKPYARLVPLETPPRAVRQPGRLRSLTVPDSFFEPLPASEVQGFERALADPLLATAAKKA